MTEFVYLYRRPAKPELSPEKLQELMVRWQRWLEDLERKGQLTHVGHPLEMRGGGVVVDAKGTFNDGPYAETKDLIGGYSVIVAKDFDAALALTHDHPVFEMGGMIEIRPVIKL
jgi:hypothetical protein